LAKSYKLSQRTSQTLPGQATTNAVLDALTVLFTRDTETVAVAAYGSPIAPVLTPDYMRLVAVVVPVVNRTRTPGEPGEYSQDFNYKDGMVGLNDGEHPRYFWDISMHGTGVYTANMGGNYSISVTGSGMSHLSHFDSLYYDFDLQ
jgi:hypothetical protein